MEKCQGRNSLGVARGLKLLDNKRVQNRDYHLRLRDLAGKVIVENSVAEK